MVGRLQQALHQSEQFAVVLDNQHARGIWAGFGSCFFGEHFRLWQVGNVLFGQVRPGLGAFVNLLWSEGFLADGYLKGKGGAVAFGAVAADVAAVQYYKIAREGQAQSRTDGPVLAVVAIVKSREQVFHLLFGNADTGIYDLDDDAVEPHIGHDVQGDGTSLGRIFGRIGQEVEDDFVHFVGVEPTHHAFRLAVDAKVQVFAHHQWFETECRLLDILHDIALAYQDFQFAGLQFAGL